MKEEFPDNIVSSTLAAFERLSEMAAERPAAADVLARWAPVVGAVQRFGITLFQVGNHLWALSRSEESELMPQHLADEVRADLAEIAAAFPGVDEVIFGTDSIDDFVDHALSHDGVRSAFATAGSLVSKQFDALIDTLVDMAMRPDSVEFSSSDVGRYFEQLERVLDKVMERWLEEAAP